MRIGIMLRALDEKGGVGVYSWYLTQKLLELDRRNHYVLFYSNPAPVGRFAHHSNVTERVVYSLNKAFWDQVAIPYAAWKSEIDVLFHPKFTVPLFASCKTVMVLHGAGWFIPEHQKFWNTWDLTYINLMMPLYCRRASAILSVSQLTTDIYNSRFHLPPGKVKTVYFGPGEHFKPVKTLSAVQKVKAKYGIPDRFILSLAKYDDGGRKNLDGVLQTYRKVHEKIPHKLVICGKEAPRLKKRHPIPNDGYGEDVLFTGWVEQEDLPVLYSLAELFLYPSNMEAFPIPITEAMACGTPIVTSNSNGLKEIAGDAAILVDPKKPEEIAEAVLRVLSDPDLQKSLSAKGLERAEMFRWEKCAKETLGILEGLKSRDVASGPGSVSLDRVGG